MMGTWEKRRHGAALSLLAVCALGACSGGSAHTHYPSLDGIERNHFEAYLRYHAMPGADGPIAAAAFTGGASGSGPTSDAVALEFAIQGLQECSFRALRR